MSSFAAETITHIGNFPITNTFTHMIVVDAILIGSALYIKNNIAIKPKFFQNAIEMIIEPFYSLADSINHKNVQIIFPYFMSFFLFIAIANLTGLLPGFGSIGFQEKKSFIPLFRGLTSDLNVTLALGLISVVATHMLSIKITGIKDYISRFISFNPIFLFVGILEITAEITKIISLSFRLFGNIFAGEVALNTISKLFAFILPVPFIFLEIIIGIVQALVFSMLTLVFMSIFTTLHHHEEVKEVNHS
ncbi:ATP synthase subunit a [Candidatus Levyibacteriota bacterium]|nr:F0F1 ATP synthase subunit A [Candidatus Levybacteria bacterium]MSU25886.1 F0F1 ATP synthase subunit A [Candidatus Levybacteria bacterium]GDX61928.1 ATP synthase subunit a [Candidatus Levybacteria bacterium]